MKKVVISLIMFFLMIIFIYFSANSFDKKCSHMLDLSLQLDATLRMDDWNTSSILIADLEKIWIENAKNLCLFIKHSEVENVYNEILKIQEFCREKNKGDTLASLSVILYYFEHLKESEKILLKNIL